MTTARLRELGPTYPLATYFTIAFTTTWLLWLALVLDHPAGDATGGDLWWLHYLGGLGPAVGAVVTTALVDGRPGLAVLGRRLSGRGAGARWILTGALLPVILLLAVVVAVGLGTGSWIQGDALAETAKLPGLPFLGFVLIELVFFGFGEETGWRGFAWRRLRARHGFLTSAALITVPWALWHLPTFAYNTNMQALGVGGTVGWVLSLFTGSIILGWLVDSAHGSVRPAALFHGILDVVFVSTAVAGVYDGPLGMAITVFAIGLVTVIEVRDRLVRPDRATGAVRR